MHKTKRQLFTNEEDKLIKELVNKIGEDWDSISKKLPKRTAKQIHDRYSNYLRDGLINEPWSPHEDKILIRMYTNLGPKWSKMMKYLPGRSGNDIKNRWHKHLIKKVEIKCKKTKNSTNKSEDDNIISINSEINPSNSTNILENNESMLLNSLKCISNEDLSAISKSYGSKSIKNSAENLIFENKKSYFAKKNSKSKTGENLEKSNDKENKYSNKYQNKIKIIKKIEINDSINENDFLESNNFPDIINSIFKDDYENQYIFEEFNQFDLYF